MTGELQPCAFRTSPGAKLSTSHPKRQPRTLDHSFPLSNDRMAKFYDVGVTADAQRGFSGRSCAAQFRLN